MIYAVYSRYFDLRADECESFEDAQATLEYGSDAGEIFAIGIYNDAAGIIYPRSGGIRPLEAQVETIRAACHIPAAAAIQIHDYPYLSDADLYPGSRFAP